MQTLSRIVRGRIQLFNSATKRFMETQQCLHQGKLLLGPVCFVHWVLVSRGLQQYDAPIFLAFRANRGRDEFRIRLVRMVALVILVLDQDLVAVQRMFAEDIRTKRTNKLLHRFDPEAVKRGLSSTRKGNKERLTRTTPKHLL